MSVPTSPIGPAEDLLLGRPFGAVNGPGASGFVPLPHLDARERALETLADFFSLITFERTGDMGKDRTPIAFRIPRERFHIYQPDDVELAAFTPSVGILPGRARHEPYGLGPPELMEETAEVFTPGTILERQGDHIETVGIEVVSAKHPERVAVVAGMKSAFRIATDSGALRLVCKNYYDRVAAFRLDESEQVEDQDAARNRRRAHLFVLMQVQEVQLVRYRTMIPAITIDVVKNL